MDIIINGQSYEVTLGQMIQAETIREIVNAPETAEVWLITSGGDVQILDGAVLVDNGARFYTK